MGTQASSRPCRCRKNNFDPSPKPTTFFVMMHRTPFWTLPSPKTRPYMQICGHLWPTTYAISEFLFDVLLASLSNNSLSVNGETLSTILVHKMIHGISSVFTMNHYDTLMDVSLLICRDSIAVAITMTPSQGPLCEAQQPRNPLLTISEDKLLYHTVAMFEHEGWGELANHIRYTQGGQPFMVDEAWILFEEGVY